MMSRLFTAMVPHNQSEGFHHPVNPLQANDWCVACDTVGRENNAGRRCTCCCPTTETLKSELPGRDKWYRPKAQFPVHVDICDDHDSDNCARSGPYMYLASRQRAQRSASWCGHEPPYRNPVQTLGHQQRSQREQLSYNSNLTYLSTSAPVTAWNAWLACVPS